MTDENDVQISMYIYLKIDNDEEYFGLGVKTDLLKNFLEFSHYFEWRKKPGDIF